MQRFKSARHAQRFLATHSCLHNHFTQQVVPMLRQAKRVTEHVYPKCAQDPFRCKRGIASCFEFNLGYVDLVRAQRKRGVPSREERSMEFRELYRTVGCSSASMSKLRIEHEWSRERLLVLTRASVDDIREPW